MMNKIIYSSDNVSKNFNKTESYNIKLLRNLIDLEYFMNSLDLLISKSDSPIELANEFNYNLGLSHKVLLPDGSRINSSQSIKSSKELKVDGISGNQNYKL